MPDRGVIRAIRVAAILVLLAGPAGCEHSVARETPGVLELVAVTTLVDLASFEDGALVLVTKRTAEERPEDIVRTSDESAPAMISPAGFARSHEFILDYASRSGQNARVKVAGILTGVERGGVVLGVAEEEGHDLVLKVWRARLPADLH